MTSDGRLATVMPHHRQPPSNDVSPLQKMFSALTGAFLTSLLVTPLDVVKFRLQSQGPLRASTATSSSATPASTVNRLSSCLDSRITNCCHEVFFESADLNDRYTSIRRNIDIQDRLRVCQKYAPPSSPTQFKGTLDGVVKIIRYEGVLSLWHGLSPTLVMAVPATVIYFVGYDYLREYFHTQTRCSQMGSALTAGALARTVAATAISPLELIRTRMQSLSGDNKSLRGVMGGIKNMVQKEGVFSLWRGLGATLARDVPFSALYWVGYETTKSFLLQQYSKAAENTIRTNEMISRNSLDNSSTSNEHTTTQTALHPHIYMAEQLTSQSTPPEFQIAFISGAISGMVAATLTTPFDVAKTRRQIDLGGYEGATIEGKNASRLKVEMESRPSSSMIVKSILKEEGWKGLFRGLTARVAKVAPACAIMISCYEMGKSFGACKDQPSLNLDEDGKMSVLDV